MSDNAVDEKVKPRLGERLDASIDKVKAMLPERAEIRGALSTQWSRLKSKVLGVFSKVKVSEPTVKGRISVFKDMVLDMLPGVGKGKLTVKERFLGYVLQVKDNALANPKRYLLGGIVIVIGLAVLALVVSTDSSSIK